MVLRYALLLGFAGCLPAACHHAEAETLTYSLENVLLQNGQPLAGTFEWTYDIGDFEGGVGEFTSIQIPYTIFSVDDGSLIYDIQTKAIEITGDFNLHDQGLDITMKFSVPFGPTQSASLDLEQSFFECCGNGFRDQPFQSGAVVPSIAVTGDYDNDGDVDSDDYSKWRDTYGSTSDLAADGNDDEIVNAADYTVWRDNLESPATATVPEPGSWMLLAVTILSLTRCRAPR